MEDDCYLAEFNEKKLGSLNRLFRDLNAISVIAFLIIFVYLPVTAHSALNGKPYGLLVTAPWLVPVFAYWYWRFKYLRVRCRRYAREGLLLEYERTLKVDSIRTPLMGATVISTNFFLLFDGGGLVLYVALFLSYFLVLMLIIGFSCFSYWWNKRRDFR